MLLGKINIYRFPILISQRRIKSPIKAYGPVILRQDTTGQLYGIIGAGFYRFPGKIHIRLDIYIRSKLGKNCPTKIHPIERIRLHLYLIQIFLVGIVDPPDQLRSTRHFFIDII